MVTAAAAGDARSFRLQPMCFGFSSLGHVVGPWTHATNGGTVRPKAISGGASG